MQKEQKHNYKHHTNQEYINRYALLSLNSNFCILLPDLLISSVSLFHNTLYDAYSNFWVILL